MDTRWCLLVKRKTRKEKLWLFKKVMEAVGKVDFAQAHLKSVQSRIFIHTKARAKTQKEKSKGGVYPQTGFAASENPVEEGLGPVWEPNDWNSNRSDDSSTSAWYNSRYTAWMASVPLDLAHPTHVVLDLCFTRSIGSREAIRRFQKYAVFYGITT